MLKVPFQKVIQQAKRCPSPCPVDLDYVFARLSYEDRYASKNTKARTGIRIFTRLDISCFSNVDHESSWIYFVEMHWSLDACGNQILSYLQHFSSTGLVWIWACMLNLLIQFSPSHLKNDLEEPPKMIPSGKLTQQWNIPIFLTGNTSSLRVHVSFLC